MFAFFTIFFICSRSLLFYISYPICFGYWQDQWGGASSEIIKSHLKHYLFIGSRNVPFIQYNFMKLQCQQDFTSVLFRPHLLSVSFCSYAFVLMMIFIAFSSIAITAIYLCSCKCLLHISPNGALC